MLLPFLFSGINVQQIFLFSHVSCPLQYCFDPDLIIPYAYHFIVKRSFEFKIRRFKPLFYYHLNNLPRCVFKPLTGLANSLKSKVSSYLTNTDTGVGGICPSEW